MRLALLLASLATATPPAAAAAGQARTDRTVRVSTDPEAREGQEAWTHADGVINGDAILIDVDRLIPDRGITEIEVVARRSAAGDTHPPGE